MKSLRLLFMVLVGCALTATSFTSCINDDEDNTTLTKEEAARRLGIMQGSYYGNHRLAVYCRSPSKHVVACSERQERNRPHRGTQG